MDHKLPDIHELVEVDQIVRSRREPIDQDLITNMEKLSNLVAVSDDPSPMSQRCSYPVPDITCSINDIEDPLLLSRLERSRTSGKRRLSIEPLDAHQVTRTPPSTPNANNYMMYPTAFLGSASKHPKRRRLDSDPQNGSEFDQPASGEASELSANEILPDMLDDFYDAEEIAIETFHPSQDIFSDDKENWDPVVDGFTDGTIMQADEAYLLDEEPGRGSITSGSRERDYAGNGSFDSEIPQCDRAYLEGDHSMVDGSFDALDFDAQSMGPTQVKHTRNSQSTPSESLPTRATSCAPLEAQKRIDLPSFFNCTLSALAFSHLRSARVHTTPASADNMPDNMLLDEDGPPFEATVENTAPEDIFDRNTLRLKEGVPAPTFRHRYLASLDVLQKRALVRELRSNDCAVELVERQSLDGAHLILDPFTAVILVPLLTLPSACTDWVNNIVPQSQKYTFINIIFEAYPESCAIRSKERKSEISAYTPPIMKAVRKFRRDISIAEAYNEHLAQCNITYAFADTVHDAARLVRMCGDLAEGRDMTDGVLWDDRPWLDAEQHAEVRSFCSSSIGSANPFSQHIETLVSAPCINYFVASIILSQVSFEEFLNQRPEHRLAVFGRYVGNNTIVCGFSSSSLCCTQLIL